MQLRNSLLLLVLLITSCGPAVDSGQMRRAENSNIANANSNAAPQSVSTDAELAKEIEEIAKEANGRVGVYAEMIDGEGTVSLNSDERFSMQSVVKVPIAMAVLSQGKYKLDGEITIAKDELVPDGMHSPFRDKNPNGGNAAVGELIELAVSVSDGTAADVLQRVAGGAAGVQAFIDSVNIDAMKVKYTHKEFSNSPERQYENWASPRAAVSLLKELQEYPEAKDTRLVAPPRILSVDDVNLLRRLMTETPTGPNRLKGLLPKDTVVIHKTGSSGTVNGKTAATNDIGLIKLPNGKYFAIAVFVGDSMANVQTREAVIAKIAKAVWDKWSSLTISGGPGAIDFALDGISVDTTYSEVSRLLGKGKASKITVEECSNEKRFNVEYPGLVLGFLGSSPDIQKFDVISMELTSTKYKFSGLTIGVSKDSVISVYGEPSNYSSGDQILYYYAKSNLGGITFYLENDAVKKVVVSTTLC